MKHLASCAALLLVACSGGDGDTDPVAPDDSSGSADDAMQTRPAGQPRLVTKSGRIEAGTECRILHTPDGERWAFNEPAADFAIGEYVSITGEIADASLCMEGEGTLIVQHIGSAEPPARDRDPARAGGIALTEDYLIGSWSRKGGDCDDPDFTVERSPGALVLEADISRHDRNAAIVLGNYPRIDLDEPMDDLPLESRGPDGVAILRPATDAAYDPVSVGSATITGDGVVFVKCA